MVSSTVLSPALKLYSHLRLGVSSKSGDSETYTASKQCSTLNTIDGALHDALWRTEQGHNVGWLIELMLESSNSYQIQKALQSALDESNLKSRAEKLKRAKKLHKYEEVY